MTLPGVGLRLPILLSASAGAADVIGFLALGGCFTAHITGNLVVIAAHYVIGGFGQAGPLLAVPVFVAVLAAVVLLYKASIAGTRPRLKLLVLMRGCYRRVLDGAAGSVLFVLLTRAWLYWWEC